LAGVYTLAESKAKSFNVAAKLAEKAPEGYFELLQSVRQVGVSYSATSEDIRDTTNDIFKLSSALGMNAGEVGKVAVALLATGVVFKEFDEQTKKTMVNLATTFGMGADEVAKLQSNTAFMNVSITELTDKAVEFQQKYKFPGLLKETRQISEATIEAISAYGDAFVGQGERMSTTLLRNTALFGKAFSVTATEAVAKAVEQMQKFNEELFSIQKLKVGLGDGISEIGKALFAGGAVSSLEDLKEMLEDGKKDPVGFATRIKEMLKGFKDSGQIQFAERLRIQVTEAADAQTRALLNNKLAYAGALKAQKEMAAFDNKTRDQKTGVGGIKRMEEFTEAFRGSFLDLQNQFGQLLGNVKMVIFNVFGGDAKEIFGPAIGMLKAVNDQIIIFAEWLRTSTTYQKVFKPLMIGAAKAAMMLAAGFGVLAGAMAMVTTGFVGLVAMIAPVKILLAQIGKLRGKAVTASEAISKRLVPAADTAAKGLTKAGAKMGAALGSKGAVGKGAGWLAKISSNVGGSLIKGFGGLFKTVMIFGKAVPGLNVVIGVISGLMTAYKQMKDVFTDPDATGTERFVAIVKATLYGLLDFIDSAIFFGIGSLIKNFFFEDIGNSIDGWLTSALSNISLMDVLLFTIGLVNPAVMALAIVNAFFPLEDIFNSMAVAMQDAGTWMANEMPKYVTSAFEEMGFVIGAVLKYLLWDMWIDGAKFVMNGLSDMFNPKSSEGGGLIMSAVYLMAGLGHAILGAIWGTIKAVYGAVKGFAVGVVAGIMGDSVNAVNDALLIGYIRSQRMFVKIKNFAGRQIEYAAAYAQFQAARVKKQAGTITQAEFNTEAQGFYSIKRELDRDKAKFDKKTDMQVTAALDELNLKRETAKKARKITKDAMKDQEKDAKKDQDKSIRNAIRNNKHFQSIAAKARASIIAAKKKAEAAEGSNAESIQRAVSSEQQKWTKILKPLEQAMINKMDPKALAKLGRKLEVKANSMAEVRSPAPVPTEIPSQRGAVGTPAATKSPVTPSKTSQAASSYKTDPWGRAYPLPAQKLEVSITGDKRGIREFVKVEIKKQTQGTNSHIKGG